MAKHNRINGNLAGEFTESQLREIEAYEAGPFTSCPRIQPHEELAVETDRQTAVLLGFNDADTEAYINTRLMHRRQVEHIRRQEQLRIGESANIILNPALKREYARQIATQNKPREYGPNLERDKWLYGRWQQEQSTWADILTEFQQCRASKQWRVVSSINGIKTAAERYANAHQLPFRRGSGGRPRQVK